jgi:hypothetical protein
MTLHRMSPPVVPLEVQRVPVVPKGLPLAARAWLIAALAVIPAVMVLVDDRTGLRLVMGALAIMAVTVGVCLRIMLGTIEPRVVRVVADVPTLHFAPPASATVPTLGLGVAALLPGIAQLIVDVVDLPTMSGSFLLGRAPYVLGILGIGVIVVQLWRLRVPEGLELTPQGIRGIRGSGRVDWRWDDLAQVSVIAPPVAKLSLVPNGGGRPVLAPTLILGSDPNEVAAIVRYYLERPAERAALAEGGVEAVRRVEDALSLRP